MAPSEPVMVESDALIRRLCWVIAAMLLLTHALLAWLGRLPAVTPAANDDALYLLLARSLGSLRYLDLHVIGSPVHAQYPPAYPAALALGAAVMGPSLNVAQGLTILFSTLALLLVFDLARRFAGPVIGVLVLLPLVLNRSLLIYAGRISTEPPYMFFSIATIWVLTCLSPGTRQYVLAGGLAIIAALTRSVGVALLGGVLLLWLFQRRFKPAMLLAGVSALTVGGWLYWTTVAPFQFTERSYAAVATSTAQHFSGPAGLLLTRAINFVKVYLGKSFAAGLQVPTIDTTVVDNAFWLGLFLVFGGIGFWALRRRGPALPFYFLSYCGLLLLYPYKMTRFIMPVEPLLLLAVMLGLVVMFLRWGRRVALALTVALSLTLAVNAAPRAWEFAGALRECDRTQALVSKACFKEDRLAFFEATRFAKATLPASAAVLTIKEATFYYYTGHRVLHPDLAMQKGKDDVLGFVQGQGIEYILVTPFVGGAEIVRPLLPACSRLELVKDFGYRTILLRIHARPEGIAHNACQNLTNIQKSLAQEEAERQNDASL